MTLISKGEAKAVIDNATVSILADRPDNPHREALQALLEEAAAWPKDIKWACYSGYILGRAVGIREERQRRKTKGATPGK